MQTENLFTRNDTMLGICEGLGEDLRINANLIRVAFALGLFFNPVVAVMTYLGAGVLVLATRLIFPVAKRPAADEQPIATVSALPQPEARAFAPLDLAA